MTCRLRVEWTAKLIDFDMKLNCNLFYLRQHVMVFRYWLIAMPFLLEVSTVNRILIATALSAAGLFEVGGGLVPIWVSACISSS